VQLKTEETGKLFPMTDDAHTVLDALVGAVHRAGAAIRPGCRVQAIHSDGDRFTLDTSQGPLHARRVIIATGGMSLPKTGSDGGGYKLAQALGHTIATPRPALVPLVLEVGHWLTRLSGIAVPAVLTLHASTGRVLHRQDGPMLFTHFGLSGPAVMDISRHWIIARAADAGAHLTANLCSGWISGSRRSAFDQADAWLQDQARAQPRSTVAGCLGEHVPQRLAGELCRSAAAIEPTTPLAQLGRESRRDLAHILTALPLPVVRDRGFLFAEATAGGVPLSEIDPATMASRRCPGLFLCGEILDVDGRIGGYNFQWAWASGRLAGIHAARQLTVDSRQADSAPL
jgi:hypothetical protein